MGPEEDLILYDIDEESMTELEKEILENEIYDDLLEEEGEDW